MVWLAWYSDGVTTCSSRFPLGWHGLIGLIQWWCDHLHILFPWGWHGLIGLIQWLCDHLHILFPWGWHGLIGFIQWWCDHLLISFPLRVAWSDWLDTVMVWPPAHLVSMRVAWSDWLDTVMVWSPTHLVSHFHTRVWLEPVLWAWLCEHRVPTRLVSPYGSAVWLAWYDGSVTTYTSCFHLGKQGLFRTSASGLIQP